MADTLDPLLFDLVAWVTEPRPYAEVMEAWRTSCPRLSVWEEASDRGFLERKIIEGKGLWVVATKAGEDFLQAHRRASTLQAKG
jgi:hypothetical protein